MSAFVTARINPFKEALTKLTVDAGTKVSEVIEQLKMHSSYHALCYVNGAVAAHGYALQENDVLNITAVPGMPYYNGGPAYNGTIPWQQPQQPKNWGRPLLGGLLGAGGLGLSYLLSRFSGGRTADSDAKQNSSGLSGYIPPAESLPIKPEITGIANQLARRNKVPYLAGEGIFRPPHAATPYTLVNGQELLANFAFNLGYGSTDYSEHKIGEKSVLSEIPEMVGFEIAQVLSLFPFDTEQTPIAKPVLYDKPITQQAAQLGDELSIVLQFDGGLFKRNITTNQQGQQVITYSNGSVNVKIEVRNTAGGSWYAIAQGAVYANSQSSYRFAWATPISRNALYEVRVTRLDADSTDMNHVNAFSWLYLRATRYESPVRQFYDSNGNIVPVNLVGMRIKPSENLQGFIEDYNVRYKHRCATYNGTSWGVPVITRNPAWTFVDMLTGPAFNSKVSRNDIDAAAFKSWADYCDLNGYKFDYVFDQGTDISEALKMVASAGRASYVIRDGKYTPVVDRPQTVITQHFTPANAWDFAMSRAWPVIPQALEINFANQNLKGETDQRIVYADGYGPWSTNIVSQKMDLPGKTDPAEVYKVGRWLLRTMRLRPVTYELTTDIQQLCCEVGGLVRQTSDTFRHGIGEGLIRQVFTDADDNITAIRVDQSVVMLEGQSYAVRVRLSNNASYFRAIKTVAGEQFTLTFQTPIPAVTNPAPAVNDLFMCGLLDNDSAEMMVVAIEHDDDLTARIVMLDYSPQIYAAESEAVPPYTPNVTERSEFRIVAPLPKWLSTQSNEDVLVKLPNDSYLSQMVISMELPADPRATKFEYQFRRSDSVDSFESSNWGPTYESGVATGKIFITGVEDGIKYDIRVRSKIPPSVVSEWLPLPSHTVIGKLTPPPNCGVITRIADTEIIRIPVDNPPKDFVGIILKWAQGDFRHWPLMPHAVPLLTSNQFNLAALPKGLITIGAKAIDAAGIESNQASWLVLNLGDQLTENVVLEKEYHPTFEGTITNGSIVSGEIVADDTGEDFWGDDDNALFWDADDSALFWEGGFKRLVYEFAFLPHSSLAEKAFNIIMRPGIELLVDAAGFLVEYRRTGETLFWDNTVNADDLPFWGEDDDAPFWDESEVPWQPWPGSVPGSYEEYQFRITLFETGDVVPKIKEVAIISDMPDKIKRISNFEVSDLDGTRLNLGGEFTFVDNITFGVAFDGANVVKPAYSDKQGSPGPLIHLFDSNDDPTTGIVDLVIQGY